MGAFLLTVIVGNPNQFPLI